MVLQDIVKSAEVVHGFDDIVAIVAIDYFIAVAEDGVGVKKVVCS